MHRSEWHDRTAESLCHHKFAFLNVVAVKNFSRTHLRLFPFLSRSTPLLGGSNVGLYFRNDVNQLGIAVLSQLSDWTLLSLSQSLSYDV